MPRRPRNAPGGLVYHVLNRGVAHLTLFDTPDDYEGFIAVMAQAMARHPTRLLGYCVMPNHWHLVLWPREDGEMGRCLRWMTHTHVMRWQSAHGTSGSGHLYRDRFKAFPVQSDEHLPRVLRYVERNPLRSGLARRAEQWRWSSLHADDQDGPHRTRPPLSSWPVGCPHDWLARVNQPETGEELMALRRSVQRSAPYGSIDWSTDIIQRLGLEWTVRARGRPRKRI